MCMYILRKKVNKFVLTTIIIILMMVEYTFADTYTSTTSGDWTAGPTWVGGVAPTATDNAIIAAGTVITLPNGGTGAHIINLTVNYGGVLSIGNKSVYIDGNLILNGAIIAGAINSDLHMTALGATIDGTGYIDLTGSSHQYFYIDNDNN